MLHKLGYDYICERCGKPASDDDSSACDYENNLCNDCVDADIARDFFAVVSGLRRTRQEKD